MRQSLVTAAVAALVSSVSGQNCISLSGSTTCPAFNASSISTDSALRGLYPFLQYVSDLSSFDRELRNYANTSYVRSKYQNILGCTNVNTANTTGYYARYTLSFLCNGIVQNSRNACGLTDTTAVPLCANACASFATSESEIATNSELCSGRYSNYVDQLRADFTNCALPSNSITGQCITGASNEPTMCGFGTNMVGLCSYCRASTENATDSCCLTSNATGLCQNVKLPVFSTIASLIPTSSTTATTSAGAAPTGSSNTDHGSHLSGGAIAGIVVGSIVGFLLLLGLLIFACILYRRRRQDRSSVSIFNQPSPQRKGGDVAAMSYNPPPSSQGYEVLPGGRVARMSAMQSDDAPQVGQRFSRSDPYGGSPGPRGVLGVAGATKASPGSNGSSPGSHDYSSPEGVASGQSEQLPFFKDYYSNDDIHPNDKVSVLWAYQPRAGDEFELERGDMLKVVGIWDDGWATGVRIDDRAEDYDGKHKAQRDSGVSNGPAVREESPVTGEIKAFPLVCVCLPEAWKKTVEGDSSTESGSGGPQI